MKPHINAKTMKYMAKSLADIAAHFDEMGKRATAAHEEIQKRRGSAASKATHELVILEAQAAAFFTARDVVKDTELVDAAPKRSRGEPDKQEPGTKA